jgi:hypothetical protein
VQPFNEQLAKANPYYSSELLKALDGRREAEIRCLQVLILETRTAPAK